MRARILALIPVLALVSGWFVSPAAADEREPPLTSGSNRAAASAPPSPTGDVMAGQPAAELPRQENGGCAAGGRRRPLGDWWQNHKLGCWSHHNYFGCGSLKSECTFIFGSCRAFFGEPCLKGPPPPVVPGDAGPSRCCHCP